MVSFWNTYDHSSTTELGIGHCVDSYDVGCGTDPEPLQKEVGYHGMVPIAPGH